MQDAVENPQLCAKTETLQESVEGKNPDEVRHTLLQIRQSL